MRYLQRMATHPLVHFGPALTDLWYQTHCKYHVNSHDAVPWGRQTRKKSVHANTVCVTHMCVFMCLHMCVGIIVLSLLLCNKTLCLKAAKGRKTFIRLTFLGHRPSWRGVRAGTQAGIWREKTWLLVADSLTDPW